MSLDAVLQRGLTLQMPLPNAGNAGLYFYATDTGVLWLCDGTAWAESPLAVVAQPSGAGHAIGLVPDAGDTAGATRYLCENGAWGVPLAGSSGTHAEQYLAADVPMPSANTPYSGPSITPTAGTYMLHASATMKAGTADEEVTAEIWDGTATLSSGEGYVRITGVSVSVMMTARVTTDGSKTFSVQAYGADAGCTLCASTTQNPRGNTATYIFAVPTA